MSEELEVIDAAPHANALAVVPQVQASELVARLAVIREAMQTAMERDVDYGVIPGTDKPTLLKPGAEKLSVLFQLDVQITNEKTWGPDDHLRVESKATVFHAPTGQRLGSGEGLCSTRERKYAVRRGERECPACGAKAIIKGKAEYGGGWLCWKKRDGCGAKFSDGDRAIEDQQVGDVPNPDIPDLWNTIVKMAQKRARIDAVLAVTGASALFTQDVGDDGPVEDYAPPPEPRSDVTPPAPPIGDEEGLRLLQVSRNAAIPDASLAMALSHLLGFDTGDLRKLGTLTQYQAEKLVAWIERKAAEAQPDDTPIDDTPEARMQALMEAGCICSDPLDGPHDDDCPVHGPSAAPAP